MMMRWAQGRAFLTCQMRLKAESIMFIIASEVNSNTTAPIEDKPVARLAKLDPLVAIARQALATR